MNDFFVDTKSVVEVWPRRVKCVRCGQLSAEPSGYSNRKETYHCRVCRTWFEVEAGHFSGDGENAPAEGVSSASGSRASHALQGQARNPLDVACDQLISQMNHAAGVSGYGPRKERR